MRLLLIHADKFEYESKEKAVKEPESIPDHAKKGTLQDGLVVFTTVEKGDEQSPENTATNAAASIEEVLGWLKTNRVMIYPYAHLSTDLAGREPAIETLKILEGKLAEKGYEVSRAPFGWYKSFTISAKGHPLSELSRTVTSGQQTRHVSAQLKSEYMVMDEKGELHSPETFQYGSGMKEFESLVEKEALKKGLTGGEPRYLEYARRFGLEWESYADLGQMRFGPESDMIIQLLSDYANMVIRRIGIPILNVRGTNMFDVDVKPIKEHLQLFGSRAYELDVDDRTFVLRYAACFQQFSMVKDWTLSYRTLPFGTFEVADSYRLEQSGELLLSFRLRKFLMPDLHIYLKNLSEAIDVGERSMTESMRRFVRFTENMSRYTTLHDPSSSTTRSSSSNGASGEEASPPELRPGRPLLLGPERGVQHHRRSRPAKRNRHLPDRHRKRATIRYPLRQRKGRKRIPGNHSHCRHRWTGEIPFRTSGLRCSNGKTGKETNAPSLGIPGPCESNSPLEAIGERWNGDPGEA